MKEKRKVEELIFKDGIYYYKEHTWAKFSEFNQVIIGITDFAQEQLGEIIFIELPSVGEEFSQDDVFGQAESAKAVSSLYMPISGKVLTINKELEGNPEIVNDNPYEAGWMIVLELKDSNELGCLLSKDRYISILKEDQ